MTYVYDGKFSGNILIVGRTGCGKTALVQKLSINKFFGELNKPEWVSFIKLEKQREPEIQSCFECELDFYYPRNKEQFEELLEYFKTKLNSSEIENNNVNSEVNDVNYLTNYGEKSIRSRLIVMDDVSGLADLSTKFANFFDSSKKIWLSLSVYFSRYSSRKSYMENNFVSNKFASYFSCFCTFKYSEESSRSKLYT